MNKFEEFIEKAREVHGNKYQYLCLVKHGRYNYIKAICPKHGEFEQLMSNHLRGHGCKKCAAKMTTTERFVEKAKKIHGNKYDYSKVDYRGYNKHVIIICPKHGEFLQKPTQHLKGKGCKYCGCGAKLMTTKEFVEKAKKIHGDKYDYSKVNYNGNKERIVIICPKHGEFEQTASSHLKGFGCRKCANDDLKMKNEEFIKEARKIHGDKYDYSRVNYINNKRRVSIVCPKHGEFQQVAFNHLRGHGCKKCANEQLSANLRINSDGFIKRARKIHGDKYDYSKVKYVNMHDRITIICPKHGEFEQIATVHLHSHGCPKCAKEINADKHRMTGEEFIEKAREVHGNKYDYSKAIYRATKELVTIICPKHGEFYQKPNDHLSGNGCPRCRNSIVQEYLYERIKEIYDGSIRLNDRTAIAPYELDIYIPDKRLAIEYNGSYWHSFDREETEEEREYHKKKHLLCKYRNIRLIQIDEHEWEQNEEIIWRIILSELGVEKGVNWVKYDGGCLFVKYAERAPEIECDRVLVDARYCDGSCFVKNGMRMVKYSGPSYVWVRRKEIINEPVRNFVCNLDSYDPNISIAENMFRNGYRRLWDAGCYLYEWRK